MMLCRPSSVLCVSSWRTCLRLSKVNVIDRHLLRGMPSIQTILNQCVEYNILFDWTFIIYLISSLVTLYKWNFSSVFILFAF